MAFAASPAFAQSDAGINEFVNYLDTAIRGISTQAGGNSGAIAQRCRSYAARVFDVDAMTRAVFAPAWDTMTPAQRAAARSGYEARMIGTCVKAVNQYHGEHVTLAGVRPGGGNDRLVATRVGTDSDSGRVVVWRLRGGSTRAVDVIFEGHSAVANAHDEYAAVLQANNGSVDALLATMRR